MSYMSKPFTLRQVTFKNLIARATDPYTPGLVRVQKQSIVRWNVSDLKT